MFQSHLETKETANSIFDIKMRVIFQIINHIVIEIAAIMEIFFSYCKKLFIYNSANHLICTAPLLIWDSTILLPFKNCPIIVLISLAEF